VRRGRFAAAGRGGSQGAGVGGVGGCGVGDGDDGLAQAVGGVHVCEGLGRLCEREDVELGHAQPERGDGVELQYFMRRPGSATEIPLPFCAFHLRFLS
jgi:hypothetical protein